MARYDKARNRNKKRDDAVRCYYYEHPEMAYQEIADMFRLKSRQHVFIIIHGNKKGG